MTTQPRLSLIVATYGRAGTALEPLLRSLLAQTNRAFEVIVVDQNRDDRIADALAAARVNGLTLRHVRSDMPNLANARNVGLGHITGDLVGYPDDDCWYEPGVIDEVYRTFLDDDAIDGVVGRWVDNTSVKEHGPYRLDADAWRRFRGGDAPSFTLFFKASRVREQGGFDPRLGTGLYFGSSEETDLILRMLSAGLRIEHTPHAKIHHPYAAAPPLTSHHLRRARSYGRGIGALYAKHRLPLWVRLRGLTAPLLRALAAPKPHHAMALAGATVLGRLEGNLRWSLENSSTPRSIGTTAGSKP